MQFSGPFRDSNGASRYVRTTYWALGQDRLAGLAVEAGFVDPGWRMPQETGFFQPLLVARASK
ncbi:hypothetical protein [Streptomyces chartreusis]